MKRAFSVILVVVLSLSLMLLCGCEKKKSETIAHIHSFADGKCACGKYEAKFISSLPMNPKYTATNESGGTVEKIQYKTHAYAIEELTEKDNLTIEKIMYVYLPKGYDETKDYNVMYLMHGGGESEEYWMISNIGKVAVAMFDNIIEMGIVDPLIIVTPTFYSRVDNVEYDEEQLRMLEPVGFGKELRNEVIPLIESKYSTYANADVSIDGLQKSRNHRAFAGFSMGSLTTIQAALMQNLDLISCFGSFSGSLTKAIDVRSAITNEQFNSYKINYYYNGNGTSDMAHDEHQQFAKQLQELMPDKFVDGKNFAWIDYAGGSHSFKSWIVDAYNCLQVFFK